MTNTANITKTYKGSRGWTSSTEVDIGGGQIIEILTMKRCSGRLVTTAQCQRKAGFFNTYMPFSDFNKVYIQSTGRCTQKAVETQQQQVLDMIEQIKIECAAHYKK